MTWNSHGNYNWDILAQSTNLNFQSEGGGKYSLPVSIQILQSAPGSTLSLYLTEDSGGTTSYFHSTEASNPSDHPYLDIEVIVCDENGGCVEGECTCNQGYAGDGLSCTRIL